jgi:hypothetical protein
MSFRHRTAIALSGVLITSVLVTSAVVIAGSVTTTANAAQPSITSAAKNGNGQTLVASKRIGLDPNGQVLTIKGKGFTTTVGIYVALCVTPIKGQKPSPCGGGVDMDGSSKASAWISSNPPPYARNLTTPYRADGSFTTRIKVSPLIGDVDCRTVACSIVARADHLRADDRRYDVAIPVTFR